MQYKTIKMIECTDFDKLVEEVYGRPYCFQRHGGGLDRGVHYFDITEEDDFIDYEDEDEVTLEKWLARDPNQKLDENQSASSLRAWWEQEFYPDLDILAYDLYKKGHLEVGEYAINVDW